MSRFDIDPSDEEIDETADKIKKQISKGGYSKYPGMTYEQGLIDMLDWLTGYSGDNPYQDD